jgi:hypothetical protein
MTTAVRICHGRRLEGADLPGFITSPVDPGRPVSVRLVHALAEPSGELLWRSDHPATPPLPAATEQLWRESDGRLRYRHSWGPEMRIDTESSVLEVTEADPVRVHDAVGNVAIPLLTQRDGRLLLHAAVAANGSGAVAVCAASGSGKSSLLAALVTAGWQALGDELCAVDLDAMTVSPGPAWSRLPHGTSGPAGSTRVVEGVFKDGWDLGAAMAVTAVPLRRAVVLDPPGGTDHVWQLLEAEAAIAALAPHAVWLGDPHLCAATVFPQVVALAHAVPVFRLRLPLTEAWTVTAVGLLAS